jgi:hypothetical protein
MVTFPALNLLNIPKYGGKEVEYRPNPFVFLININIKGGF